MSSDTALTVKTLSKVYRIYDRPIDRIRELYSIRRRKYHHEFTALNEVSFEVDRGETVGIIGPNGSGKSTLLEIISGTLMPTSGQVNKAGQVAALLELGAGFNPTFSGRENVYLNASILGIPKKQLESNLDNILSFADIGEFIDHPVSTYSSGMYVRLAFATAINTDPDILVVDEALAVGDIRFQRKCFRRFQEMQSAGKTIIFVSHSVELIQAHCSKAIFLNHGHLQIIGEPKEVIQEYLEYLFGSDQQQLHKQEESGSGTVSSPGLDRELEERYDLTSSVKKTYEDDCKHRRSYNPNEYRWGDQRAVIFDYQLETSKGTDQVQFESGDTVTLSIHVRFLAHLTGLIYGCTIKTVDGRTVYGTNTRERQIELADGVSGETTIVQFRFDLNLIPGDYFISVGVALDDGDRDNIAVDRRYDLAHLTVTGSYGEFGIAYLNMSIVENPSLT